jgi:hypothetical protein
MEIKALLFGYRSRGNALQEVMLYQKIGFAEFRWDYFAYGS